MSEIPIYDAVVRDLGYDPLPPMAEDPRAHGLAELLEPEE